MRRRSGFTLVEVTVALVVLAVGAAAVMSALIGVQRSAVEARRLGAQLAVLANASEAVRVQSGLPAGRSPCPGVRPADYPELGSFRCELRRAPGARVVEVVLIDDGGRVFAATVGALR